MRLSEISQNAGIDKFIVALRNHIGRAASQGAPAQLTWDAVAQMSRANGFEFAADYETFKAMYDANPIIQNLVANFNDKGIVLKVPGVTDKKGKTPDPKTSQGEVDKIAASNAEKNLESSEYANDPLQKISKNLKQRYHDKATSTINNVKPYTKKGEYQDLAKRLVARREAGLNKVKNSRNDMRLRDITDEAIVSQDDPNRDAIRSHQARQHRAGNKISWQQAKQEIDDKLNPPQPKKQRAPKAPRRPSLGMSSARFQKIMKGAAQDFQSDFGDQEYGLEDVAWDLAGSLMHDLEVSKYVRGTIARNAGMRPDEVDSNVIQDYIADEIFSAGSANESTAPVDETYFGREIYFIKFTGKPATSIDNIMHNMKKKLVSFEVVDARAATGGEFGNDETEQAFSVDQADGSKIDKWINKTNYVELLDSFNNKKPRL